MIKNKWSKMLLSISFVISSVIAVSSNAYALNPAGGTWSVVGSGPVGARYDSIAVDPFNTNNIYVVQSKNATPGRATLKSSDGGATWNLWTFTFQGQALTVDTFTLEAVNKTIFIESGTRLFVSPDGGTTWAEVGVGFSNAIIKNSNGIIHINQYGYDVNGVLVSNILKSVDGGMTWSTLGATLSWNMPLEGYYVDDATGTWYRYGPNAIFANGTNNSLGVTGVQKSTDAGVTWTDLTTSIPMATSTVDAFWVDSVTGNLLAFLDEGNLGDHLYVSLDGGSTWQAADTGGRSFYFYQFTVTEKNKASFFYEDAFNSGLLYLAGDLTFGTANLVSLDGGLTWSNTNFPDWWSCKDVSLATDASGVVYCASDNGNNFLGSALIKFVPAQGLPTSTPVTTEPPTNTDNSSDISSSSGGGCVVTVPSQKSAWFLFTLSVLFAGIFAMRRRLE